ncbi:unnamed protein product [Adineta steineri]|uniref:G-protein coupled receptors family 1 profile domain-containing protein n=1 Tax=Adineta steineri TaxID=433720 RepID=A0A813QPR6_9BILA|nr:unnamed protein product [Adineta steineri]
MVIAYIIRCWIYLIFVIPSLLCSIFNLYHFIVDRTLRKALYNHIIILILSLCLLYNITDIIWLIHFYRTISPISYTYIFCILWTYIDFAPFVSITLLVAWASIERHILIFHQNLVSTRTKRLFAHYLPMIIFTLYPLIYYMVMFFIIPCSIPLNYAKTRCGLTNCAYPSAAITMYDGIAHNILPVFSIVVFSIALIGRVWYNKYRMGQRFQWKKYRKMTIQLLSISSVYFFLLFPPMILNTAYAAGVSYSVAADFYSGAMYISYLITLLIPFVCTAALPELRAKFPKIPEIYKRKSTAVVPVTFTLNRLAASRTAVVTHAAH